MGRRIKVQEVHSGNRIRIAATAYKLSSDPVEVKNAIDASRREAKRWLYFCKMKEKLNELIESNFGPDDWSIVLTCDNTWVSGQYERLRAEWRRALARLRYARRKALRPEPVYVYVVEGVHGDKHPHIHVLLKRSENAEADIAELNRVWKAGEVLMDEFRNVEWYSDPAQYLTKEPNKFVPRKLDRNCFVASHNCTRPVFLPPYYVESLDEIEIPEGYTTLADNRTRNRCGALRGGQIVSISRFLTLEAV